jgi:two-component system chemotaxis response regulator CheB
MLEMTLRTLVVDDSGMYRKIIQHALESLPNVEIVGTASNGRIALIKAASLKPDLITLDIEMPEMDGLETLEHLRTDMPDVSAIVFSNYTTEGARITLKALELGAFDFIPKPSSGSLAENTDEFKSRIMPIIDALIRLKREAKRKQTHPRRIQAVLHPAVRSAGFNRGMGKSKAVAIGISTGGPVALTRVLPGIPSDIDASIFIVQHMPPLFTDALAKKLDLISQIQVKEAVNGETIQSGTAYIAPGGKQMGVESFHPKDSMIIRVTDDPPENNCRPSADYLFRSVARAYGRYATGVIMTGMGHDGTEGLRQMKECGAVIIAQDEATSAVYGMPRKPVELGIVDVIAPLGTISEEICRTVR